MNKHKDKHHPQEETGKTGRAAETPGLDGDKPPAGAEESQKARPAAEHGAAGKLKTAEEEIAGLQDQLLRLRADFDNFRKRSVREKGEIYENANESLLLELLPVIDHIQLAVKSASEHKLNGPASASFQEGLKLIADQLMDTLAKFGLEPFNSEKQPFEPNLHEAISALPSETEPEGVIIAQSRQGYRFKKKILRPAQVVVSSGKPASLQGEIKESPA
jgi:molecular chaperone GrpE